MKRLVIMGFLFGIAALTLPSCQKELSTESNSNDATFSLLSDSDSCLMEPEVSGTYYNGVTSNRAGNFVTVVVNVKTTGNYEIKTDSSNGFIFRASGFFSKVGIDTLTLAPSGKPILIGLTDFIFNNDSSACPFTVNVEDSTGTGLGGVDTSGSGAISGYSASYVDPTPASDDTWHFTDSTNNKSYSGKMSLIGSAFSSPILAGSGTSSSNASDIFNYAINTPAIVVGSFPLDGNNTVALTNAPSGSIPTPIYSAVGDAPQEDTDPSSINITSYSGGRIKISFRCWADDANGNPAMIKGSINSKVQ